MLSAFMNFAFGLSSGLTTLGLAWVLNGWFQGMGFPPCARVLTHWFSPKELGTFWGLWNTSHQVGGALIYFLAGVLASHWGWRACFLVPAPLSVFVALWHYDRLRDTPGSPIRRPSNRTRRRLEQPGHPRAAPSPGRRPSRGPR